jgi:single-stranded-DNA-specific exonuclease
LIGSDKQEVERVGKVLFELNQARKEIERSIFNDVVQQVEKGNIDPKNENIIIAASSSWPPGVIGLVASRVVGMYGKPTILFHITKEGIAKGSCRSIPEFNMFNALQTCGDIITNFGGHSLAAGLALPQANVAELKARLEARIRAELTDYDLLQKMKLDAQLNLGDLQKKFVHDMSFLEPFGNSNSQPTFYLKNITLVQEPRLLKDVHVKCMVFADGVVKPLMFFNRFDLFEKFLKLGNEPFDAAVHVSENHWNGNVSIELIGVDVKFATQTRSS